MKRFLLNESRIQRITSEIGYCYASDEITVKGKKVGYMYREKPERDDDSGLRFFAGNESDEYSSNPENFSIFSVNTVANYDPDIITYLNVPVGSALERDGASDRFVKVDV